MTRNKRALITGIYGQDGSYLTELLLSKGYDVFGLVRPEDRIPHELKNIYERVTLYEGDVCDYASIACALRLSIPDEVYNLASPSSVVTSLDHPAMTSNATALGPARIMEALRDLKLSSRFFQASSQEIFGDTNVSPQNEATLCRPRNPYGVGKLFAHNMVDVFRKQFGMYAVSGILYNHESPRRAPGFVTRKITSAVARIKNGSEEKLILGDLRAQRDWGYAPEYVEAMWLMLQQDAPEDYVVATGAPHSVEEFVGAAFSHIDLDWREHVKIDDGLKRRADKVQILGDSSKAKEKLHWEPRVTFSNLVQIMVDADMHVAQSPQAVILQQYS
ncbi:MAG: GDPmannose 4,6-dehydratase [Parcubacteria group bacterium Gr01-1014_48]|nr:MAG: GDPmannose 4,6-dehydratase [Parcubacteria group bacterium Greene0416_14]TSC74486.1 MAG: GDPmannose 4,6-dehydratase [Parcubacteria group bacterium Gr01-1014_48]TSD00344.1 MAG: GDPmannose 4,6-dehydratase [Parcubacteria group bacterium Greene1014_15]TSD07755.1 MAG: GDPmannose 4,6-dehydratase [Parcubacteria group bacterium Greene0714_4]